MKNNNKPRILRLINNKNRLQYKLDRECEEKPYGGGNPYYYCASCERSMIEVSYAGHYSGCKHDYYKGQIKALEKQIDEEILNLDLKKVARYCWFNKDFAIDGLREMKNLLESKEIMKKRTIEAFFRKCS